MRLQVLRARKTSSSSSTRADGPWRTAFCEDRLPRPPPRRKYPLDVHWCETCGLVQIGYVVPPEEIFTRLHLLLVDLGPRPPARPVTSREASGIGSGSGKLLAGRGDRQQRRDGVEARSGKRAITVLGVEPASNIAKAAIDAGIETVGGFLPRGIGARDPGNAWPGRRHPGAPRLRPRPRDPRFRQGLKHCWRLRGAVAIEAPYLVDFLEKTEFDTVYHEHYSYLSRRLDVAPVPPA